MHLRIDTMLFACALLLLGCADTHTRSPQDVCVLGAAGCGEAPSLGDGAGDPDDAVVPDEPAQDPDADAPADGDFTIPLEHLPSEPLTGLRVIDLAIGPEGDLWLLGELDEAFGARLFVERLGPDGSSRWGSPWFADLLAARIGIGPEGLPTGRLVVDAAGRATVCAPAQHDPDTIPSRLWLSQISGDGRTLWTTDLQGLVLAGIMVDGADRIYTLAQPGDGDASESALFLSRHLPDGTLDAFTPVSTGTLTAPVELVPAAPAADREVFLVGSIAQIFGNAKEAFVGRFSLDDGRALWPPLPPATGPRDYTGAVAARTDRAGGVLVAVATDIPDGVFDLTVGPSLREVRRIDGDGDLRWATALRTAAGETRREGYVDWEVLLAVDATGGSAVVYGIDTDPSGLPFPSGALELVVDRLDAEGAFVWPAPRVLDSDGTTLPRGAAFAADGSLYVVHAPSNPSLGGLNWLTRVRL